ncbi:MAG: hypothetical protein HKN08_04350, partial [Gammaproteobacteria bacterium]|nr:hypothetical protein [Gammaproteobacteria bacterium]
MNSNYDYCRDKATPPGSNFYYSILFENEEIKSTVIPLLAMHNEIIDCLTASPDPGVTRLKFNWWHEELSRLSDNIPRHPVTQTIKSFSNNNPNLVTTLHEQLVTIESIVSNEQSADQANWLEHNFNILGRYYVALNRFQTEQDNQYIIQNGGLVFGLELFMLYPLFATKAPGFIPAELVSRHVGPDGEILFPDVFGELICDFQLKLNHV